MHVSELLQFAASQLKQAGIEEHTLDARLLLGACLGKTRTELFLLGETPVTAKDQAAYLDFIDRRKRREPVAYILGEQEFWSMPFFVTPAVLIPRPETEFLLDQTLSLVLSENLLKGSILDLCCGSGIIATVLAKETGRPIIASDISAQALSVARANLCRHNCQKQVALVEADLFSAFQLSRGFSVIVSNPPYVSRGDLENNLQPEVAMYEPRLALDGGEKGLYCIARIRQDAGRLLCPGGQLFIEIGAEQGRAVFEMFRESQPDCPGFEQVEILVDYAGRDRVLYARTGE